MTKNHYHNNIFCIWIESGREEVWPVLLLFSFRTTDQIHHYCLYFFCYFYTLSRPIFVNLFFLSGRTIKERCHRPFFLISSLSNQETIRTNWNSRDDSFLCIILFYCQSPFMCRVCVLSGFGTSIKKHFLLFCYFNLQCSCNIFPIHFVFLLSFKYSLS